jgi:hypothetical protein
MNCKAESILAASDTVCDVVTYYAVGTYSRRSLDSNTFAAANKITTNFPSLLRPRMLKQFHCKHEFCVIFSLRFNQSLRHTQPRRGIERDTVYSAGPPLIT